MALAVPLPAATMSCVVSSQACMAAKPGWHVVRQCKALRQRHARCLLLDGVQLGDSARRFLGHRAAAGVERASHGLTS